MNRPIAICGLLVVLAMLAIPPMEVKTFNGLASAADDLLGGSSQPRSEFVATKIVYSPAWSEIGKEGEYGDRELNGKEVESVKLAVQRLLLQIVVVVVLIGGLGAIVGSKD